MEQPRKPNKPHSQSPLPFIGQKRQIIQAFRNTLDRIIPNDGQGWTVVDVFGGSGLLPHKVIHKADRGNGVTNPNNRPKTALQAIFPMSLFAITMRRYIDGKNGR